MQSRFLAPRLVIATAALLVTLGAAPAGNAAPSAADLHFPRYAHIFVLMDENKSDGEIVNSPDAPAITAFAHAYGYASRFYAESHPSEPNYVALVGGSTYGIVDDAPHAIDAPSLATQFARAGVSWKNYNESLPKAGSLAAYATDPHPSDLPADLYVYAAKHSGFIEFTSVRRDPNRAGHIVGFDRLHADLHSGAVPAFSLIIPNLCNDMHGVGEGDSPPDCRNGHLLIRRGDRHVKSLVDEIMASPVWKQPGNAAIVVTFDEDDADGAQGCCGTNPKDPANAGGGHISTIVITNRGPRAVVDPTPYSHYSLLRTIDDAFGIHRYLQHANDAGVVPMTRLFAPTR
jgi:hypothetical protein